MDRLTIEGPVFALIGPTAIGKTDLSIRLALQFNCEIISVDSMQVYRFMDIGTAKATPEDRRRISHHLIDIVDPDEDYHAARFVEDCLEVIGSIQRRGAIPLLTGGTGLYLQALKKGLFAAPPRDPEIRGQVVEKMEEKGSQSLHEELRRYDPESARRIHPHDRSRLIRAVEVYLSSGVTLSEHLQRQASGYSRVEFLNFMTVGITCERDRLYQRINLRTGLLFDRGLKGEVQGLLDRGYDPGLKSMQSIGYRHMVKHIQGEWDLDQCREYLARDTRRYAKRQYTWFNRDQSIRWFDLENISEVPTYLESNLGQKSL